MFIGKTQRYPVDILARYRSKVLMQRQGPLFPKVGESMGNSKTPMSYKNARAELAHHLGGWVRLG